MKIGFIGTGNMGSAMMGGIIKSGIVEPENVMASDIFQAVVDEVAEKYSVNTSTNNRDVVEFANIIFLAVKNFCILFCSITLLFFIFIYSWLNHIFIPTSN